MIVTVANSGLENPYVKLLAINDAKVILTCRNMKKCNEAREIIAQEDLELGDQDEKRKKVELRF
eukprot:snap_masked-scaffold_26-processed-gene-1.21-mRNA-1 protein AED:1.00 eAED:1.00 QI:0/-1/0/0/-1/1/1/0/63